MTRIAAALFAALFAVVLLPRVAAADTQITSSSFTNGFPRNVVFSVSANSDQQIVDATLNYKITGRNSSALGKPNIFDAGTSVETEVTIPTGGNDYIPVGSEFVYHWEFQLADGTSFSGPEQSQVYLPPGDWQSVENDIIRVYYQGDRGDIAQTYLDAGQQTYQSIAVDLFDTTLPVLPVKVVLFSDEADLEEARPGGGGGAFDEAVLNCGTKVTSDIVLVINRSCGTPDRTDTFRHEFGHIINEAAGESPLGFLPSWLDEGMAVHAQSAPGDNYLGAFAAAIRANRLIPFDQMGTPSSNANLVNLFYGQAYQMVDFLIQRDGNQQFAEFFATIKAGSRFDVALQQVYGFDLQGFEEAFYQANGLGSPGTTPQAAPTSAGSQSNPTPGPTRPPLQTGSGSSGDDNTDLVVIGSVGAAVLFGLLAVFFYLVSSMLANNRKARQPVRSEPPPDDEWRPPPPPRP